MRDSQDIWESKGASEKDLPGPVRDYFYQYEPLHADGRCSDISTGAPGSVWSAKNGCAKSTEQVGYFGNKVLAVSYGGTLELSGQERSNLRAALTPNPRAWSWTRLNGTIKPGSDEPERRRSARRRCGRPHRRHDYRLRTKPFRGAGNLQ